MNIGRKYEKNCKVGKPTVGSGNKWFDKGDRQTDHFLLELKATRNQSYSLKKETLEKIIGEAITKGKDWGMLINIDGKEVFICDPSWLQVLEDYLGVE